MARRRVTEPVKSWIAQSLFDRMSPDVIATELLNRAYALDSIRESLPVAANWSALAALEVDRDIDYAALANITPAATDVQKIATDKAQIYLCDDFLSASDCDSLAALINANLRPSAIDAAKYDQNLRTSRTCDLAAARAPLVAAIDAKIAKTLGIPLSHSELIQGQRYDVGEQFKEHTDFFEPGTTQCQQLAGTLGNRTWTFMIYLNDVARGGGTFFRPSIKPLCRKRALR